jgi:hypothetical protein
MLWFMASFFGLAASVPLPAADAPARTSNWDDLKNLAPGQEIRVVLNDAKSYRGKFR